MRGLEGSRAEVLNAIGFLYPVFGFTTKYLIYKPAVKFYDEVVFDAYSVGERHRGFLHSFLGIGTATVLTGAYVAPVLFVLDLLSLLHLGVFLLAYATGSILHLAEDSCTKTGIQWNYPFQDWAVKGGLTTTAKAEDTRRQRQLLTVLGVLVGALFLLPLVVERVPFYAFSVLGLVVGVGLWVGFGRFVAGCEVSV